DMKVRSPLLGFNHNIRYGGRLYHVQTEDSGVNNPHIFTHLFHAGTIIASKRANYDADADDAAVQKVMQTQHKAMLKELKAGAFARSRTGMGAPAPARPPISSPAHPPTSSRPVIHSPTVPSSRPAAAAPAPAPPPPSADKRPSVRVSATTRSQSSKAGVVVAR